MIRIFLALLPLSILLSTCSTKKAKFALQALQNPENPLYSGFKGSFSISENGAVVYSIPMPVTPGVGGMTPQISLTYNSNNSTSILGEGWALSGFSYIGRSPNTTAVDTFAKAINFSQDDKLALDGMRLLKTDGRNNDYGAEQTAYYTENNSFKRITIEKAGIERVNSIKYFRVLSKDGIETYYGNVENNDNDGIVFTSSFNNNNVPYLWLLTLSKDRNGNWIKYNYSVESNTYRPSKITYGGSGNAAIGEIDFDYETNSDSSESKWTVEKYVNGEKIVVTHPLKIITSRYLESENNRFIVRQFRLRYFTEDIDITNRLLLTNIWQYVKQSDQDDDQPFDDQQNQIVFDWTKTKLYNSEFKDSLLNTTKESVSLDEDYKFTLGDMNGDGFPDKMLYKNFSDKIVLVPSVNNGNGIFKLNTIDTFQTKINTEAKSFNGDFDADGKADLGFIEYTNSKLSIYRYLSRLSLSDSLMFKEENFSAVSM